MRVCAVNGTMTAPAGALDADAAGSRRARRPRCPRGWGRPATRARRRGRARPRRRPASRTNSRCPPVAVGDRAGLVEQERRDVAGGLDGAARHRQHVALHEPVHAGDADRRQQRADRGGDEADQQRDEHRDARRAPRRRTRSGSASARRPRRRSTGSRAGCSSAISLGVFWRLAPSTRAIMRSTNVSPGLEVMRTTMRSESTRVPPVTALRSPPDSRTTGADSPVIADSSTVAMPQTMSPSPGISSPALHHHDVAEREVGRGDRRHRRSLGRGIRRRVVVVDPVGHRAGAGLAQARGLRLAAALGHRLGEVREQHGEPEPDARCPT